MKHYGYWIAAAALAGCLCLETPVSAQGLPKGQVTVSSIDVTAKVAHINHKTRVVTLKSADGSETRFVADAAVQNLDQVKKGDLVTATYTEALAYEVVKKGGKTGADSTVAVATAPPGAKPAGAVAQNTTVTVAITSIDAKTPSVTFRGSDGNKRTIKVESADRLQGVSVGDTVTVTYVEAVAIRVDKAKK